MKTINLKRYLLIFISCLGINILQAQYQLTPECYVIIEDNCYVIHFSLPDYHFMEDNECDMLFSSIEMDDNSIAYDVTDEAGYPTLPFFSLDLLLPDYVSNLRVYMENDWVQQECPPSYIQPAMFGSWITEEGDYIQLDEECFNSEYYYNGYTEDYPNGFYRNFYSTSGIYDFLGVNGFTLSIHPFSYYPEQNYMEVLREATFVIEFDCGGLSNLIDELQTRETYNAYVAQLYFDTFNELNVTNNSGTNGRFLIIAANHDMEYDLQYYVEYKRSQHYEVEVIYLDDYNIVGDTSGIYNIMRSNDVMNNPDYVLLVGNLSDIPPFEGEDEVDNPFSDDKYHSFIGRWIVGEARDDYGSYVDLRRMIFKTIATERESVNVSSTAALFSGTDNSLASSRKRYKCIERIAEISFDQMGIPCTLYDGRYYNSTYQAQSDMECALESNPRFITYVGHGNEFLIGEPYWIDNDWINTQLTLLPPFSMGFGFACKLNSYLVDDNFGARWVAGRKGGVSFYGATINSYLSPNLYLSKRIFRELKKMTNKVDNFPISMWLRISEDKYYNALMGPVRKRQIRKYNLIGDPTLAVYGMYEGGGYAPFHMPPKDKDAIESSESSNIGQIYLVEVYDVSGKKIVSLNSEQGLPIEESLSPGVYVIKTTYIDGTININKLMK